jgi:hypothetical protein
LEQEPKLSKTVLALLEVVWERVELETQLIARAASTAVLVSAHVLQPTPLINGSHAHKILETLETEVVMMEVPVKEDHANIMRETSEMAVAMMDFAMFVLSMVLMEGPVSLEMGAAQSTAVEKPFVRTMEHLETVLFLMALVMGLKELACAKKMEVILERV